MKRRRRCFPGSSHKERPMPTEHPQYRLTRRSLLAGLAIVGEGAFIERNRGVAQTAAAAPRRIIDVHHHIMPPFYVHEHRRDQLKVGPGITQIFEWTPQLS